MEIWRNVFMVLSLLALAFALLSIGYAIGVRSLRALIPAGIAFVLFVGFLVGSALFHIEIQSGKSRITDLELEFEPLEEPTHD